jgi:hypothetical protein
MIGIIFFLCSLVAGKPFYSNSIEVTMKSGQVFELEWNNSADSISLSLSTATTGWIGIGMSLTFVQMKN